MRYDQFVLPLSAILCATGMVASAQSAKDDLHDQLESAYNTWRLHMIRGNYDGWRATTSAYRQVKVRNLVVSDRKKFPDAIFQQMLAAPPLAPLRYIGAIRKGNTAAATYYGKIDLGIGGNPTENALVLLFTFEKGKWKYDQCRFFNLAHIPKVKDRLQKGDKTVLDEQDGFQPTGTIPPIPPLCPHPKYLAKVYVDCQGRKANITINGISHHEFEDARMAEVVSGGMKDQNNTITMTFDDLPDKELGKTVVQVFLIPELPGNLPGKAFSYVVEKDQKPVNGTSTFSITPELIKAITEHNQATDSTQPAKPQKK